jgi:formylglycine-generating enzyme required for sulfatase activity
MKRLSKWVFFLLLMATLPSCSKDSNPTAPIDTKDSNTTAPIDTKDLNPTAPIETEVVQGITFVTIPGGTFQMGSNWATDPDNPDRNKGWFTDEQPVHQVTVSTFQMSATEITNTQYAAYLNTALADGEITVTTSSVTGVKGGYGRAIYIALSSSWGDFVSGSWISYNGTSFSVVSGKENWPVVFVTWYGSKAFALKYGFDLPSEKEWEYAARGGKQYEYGTDDGTLSSAKVNYDLSSLKDVGSYPANPFGLYDLAGSVWEWCNDWYASSYSSTNHTDAMVIRGSIACGDYGGRSAGRAWGDPSFSSAGVGIRVVRR